MKYTHKLTCGMAVVCALLWSAPTPPISAQITDTLNIQNLTLQVVRPDGPQVCPTVLRFNGVIESSTAGVVRYRWRTSDGEATPYSSFNLAAKEAREIVHLQRVGRGADKTSTGWVALEVIAGNAIRTVRAPFNVDCAKDPSRSQEAGNSANVLQEMIQSDGEENFLERFQKLYLLRRGYSLDNEVNAKRLVAYQRLTEMRRAQRKPHVPIGFQQGPGAGPGPGPGAPGTLDASNCAWSSVGPTNINGRVTKIAIDPTNNLRLFVTTVGGIWRSTDGARRWQRVSDDFLSTVFASVAINPVTPTEVFIGGGDPNYHGWGRGALGIWRSTVNGDPGSWSKVSPPELDNQVIYRLIVDPVAPNNVYAATSAGVYLGTRTGSAITFARLAAFDAWTNDIAINFSVTPRLIYAGVRVASASFARGIWKYDGTSWNQRNTGIPTASSRAIVLAIAQSSPSTLYAKVESNDAHSQGVYKTTTAGETPMGGGNAWTATGSALDDSCCCGICYSWYNSVLEIDPADANIVWGGGLNIYRTSDGGTSWPSASVGPDATFPLGVHADHHAVAFDPTNSKIVYVGNDGGIFRSTDTSGTWHWTNVAHNMVVTEFYRLTSQQSLAGMIAGGSQDNGTEVTFGNRTWYQPGSCDGADVAIDAGNASTLYGNCNGGLFELTNPVPGTVGGGASATWTLPAGVTIRSPLVTDSVVAGAALAAGFTSAGPTLTWRLLKTTDGLNWSNASPTAPANVDISTIGIAPSSAFQTYYIGVGVGQIWRTTNGGGIWTQASVGLDAGAVTNAVAVDNTTPSRAVAATSNGIFLTIDTGANWNSIAGTGAGALPTSAITGVVFDPSNANTVFAVTDVGAFRGTITPAVGATPPSASWIPFDEGLPDGLDINDIWVNRANGILKIGTMGHGSFQRDIRPGIVCPSARLLVRDNVNDYGVVPSLSGAPDPEHPIPDPARPGFYKPDDTDAGKLFWWNSTDVRIDVPTSAPPKNQIASADHVEMQTCPIGLADCPAGTLLDANPQRGRNARVYAQVTNTGLQPGTNVRVTALYADASPGLPLLPNDFWTTTFPAGSTTCGALDTSTGWHFADSATPCRVIPVVNPDVPEVVQYNWAVPIGQAEHSCMLIISESVSDPLDPNIRATNERRLWELVPNNRQISLRNLHIVDAAPAPAGGAPSGMNGMNIPNPTQAGFVELVFSRVDLPPDASLGLILATNVGVTAQGAALVQSRKFSEAELKRLQELKVEPNAYYRIDDPRQAVVRLPIPPGESWRIGVFYDAAPRRELETLRWSMLLRQGNTVFGGDTFYIRPRAINNGPTVPNPPGPGSTPFFSLGLRGGIAIPHGSFDTFFNPGPAATVDLEYHFTNQFSFVGLFGYRRFAGQGPVPGLNTFQFAAGPKVYLATGATRPFLNGGVGAFHFGTGTTRAGTYAGGGMQFRIRPRFWLEAEYNFHSVFTSGSNTNFSTLQGGVRFRF